MPPKTVDIPGLGSVDFPDTMSPDDINAASKRLYDEHNDPAAIAAGQAKKQAVLAAANKTPLPAQPKLSDEFTREKVVDRGLAGAAGEAKTFVGGLAGMLYGGAMALRHPEVTADNLGHAAVALGVGAYNKAAGAVADPVGTFNAVKDAPPPEWANDPEAIGGIAGAMGAMIVAHHAVGALKASPLGQAVGQGISNAVDKVPIVGPIRAAYKASKLSRMGVVPVGEASAMNPEGVASAIPKVSTANERMALLEAMKNKTERGMFAPEPAAATAATEAAPAAPSFTGPRLVDEPAATPSDVAKGYTRTHDLPEPVPHTPVKVNPAKAKEVADAYDALQHDPTNPKVQAAYKALTDETSAQFDHMTKTMGVKVEPWTGPGEPYKDSAAMRADATGNKHLFYKQTMPADLIPPDHPMMATDANGMRINDKFRAVHDYFGHAQGTNGFGPNGEENAFLEHQKMFSPDAQRALETETRGQNSWVNHGAHLRDVEGNLPGPGDPGYIHPSQRPFAPQKAALLPDSVATPPLTETPAQQFQRREQFKDRTTGAAGGSGAGIYGPKPSVYPMPTEPGVPPDVRKITAMRPTEGAPPAGMDMPRGAGTAKFAFEQPGNGDLYEITSGPNKGSHVSAGGLKAQGIPVPEKGTGNPTAQELHDLIGSRKMGSMKLADRKALMAQLLARVKGRP
jgi:hypothetical protein